MADSVVASLHSWLAEHECDLLEDYRTLLRFPSLEAPAEPGAPFGPANREALDWMLGKAAEAGMRTVDIEGYCGYAEFGEGDKMVMSLGHLDVVPVGTGWKHDPFGAELEDGYVYARGAADDKGPTMAMFYACRAVLACCPDLGVRVRNVFGCNEESGFACVHRYMETEEAPTLGVAPDAGWPCIYAEKGIGNFVVGYRLAPGPVTLLSLDGGSRPNIVVDRAVMRCRVAADWRPTVEARLAEWFDKNLTIAWDGDVLVVEAWGKASHGANPQGGDNAATRALRVFRGIVPTEQEQAADDLVDLPDLSGAGLGIAGADEITHLTLNLGIVQTVGDEVQFTLNVRYPVTWTGDQLLAKANKKLAKLGAAWRLVEFTDSPSLYFPLDHPLVKTIREVHHLETGETKEPGTMGGGTYARAVPNCVAIGTGWDGDGPAHEPDERMKVEHLFKMSRIYAHLMFRLAQVAKGM